MAAEKNFENRLKIYMKNKGFWFIKYWAGAKFTKDGVPDIIACYKGKFLGIELKAESGKPKLLQLVMLKRIREAGGIGLLLYPDDFYNFKAWVDMGCKEDTWYISNIDKQGIWFNKLMT